MHLRQNVIHGTHQYHGCGSDIRLVSRVIRICQKGNLRITLRCFQKLPDLSVCDHKCDPCSIFALEILCNLFIRRSFCVFIYFTVIFDMQHFATSHYLTGYGTDPLCPVL